MRSTTESGMNKTGSDFAPKLRDQMARGADEGLPSSAGDEHMLSQMRQEFMKDAPPVGSTPSPAKVKGAAKAGMQAARGRRPSVFIDKLGERLAFERTGTRLYEALISKLEVTGSWDGGPSRDQLVTFHDEEKKHFEIVRAAIEQLGGDPTAMTPSADVAGVISMGVLQVVTDARTSVAEALQALLVAELADNDGWQMLIRIADGLGENDLSKRFRVAFAEEDKHLASIRRWLSIEAEQELHGAIKKPPVH